MNVKSHRGVLQFVEQVTRLQNLIITHEQEVFNRVVEALRASIVEGSPITGAPGQPVQTGNLKRSWFAQYLAARRALIGTPVIYAPSIEDGIQHWSHSVRPMTVRSATGGFHSVKLTKAAFQRLVDHEVAEMLAA